MTIIITGISSFIGFHLAKYFISKSKKVIGTISRQLSTYKGIRGERLSILNTLGVNICEMDIMNKKDIEAIIRINKPKIWFHLPALTENYSSIDYNLTKSFKIGVEPLNTIYKNLKNIDDSGVIIVGSNAEYSDSDNAASEGDFCSPTMPYGLSKLATTLYSNQLSNYYNIRTRVGRVFIPFGEYDNPKKLIPTIISNLKSNKSTDLSPCIQKRDFIHINDLIEGFSLLMDDLNRDSKFDIFNICSGQALKLKDFLDLFATTLGKDKSLLNYGAISMREGEPLISYGDSKKASENLSFNSSNIDEKVEEFLND